MNPKSHPDYWNIHKKIWQKEYDNLDTGIRELVMSNPESKESYLFNKRVREEVERKLLSPV